MKPTRKLSRRSFMRQVAGGAAVSGGALMLLAGRAKAAQVTDSDPSDPIGHGRGGGTGITDGDSGPGADPYGRGRGTGGHSNSGGQTGITDSDSGTGADPVGRGRGGGGNAYQDSDNSDPVGNARRPPRDDYVDCNRTREQLDGIERQIELAEWDGGRLAEAQADLARARQVQSEMQGIGSYSQNQELEGLMGRNGVNCNFTSNTGCIDRLEEAVRAAMRGRQIRPQLYGERARLQEELRRGCGSAYQR